MGYITLLLLLSAAWIAGVAWKASLSWPRLPLDSSATDPATIAALDQAMTQHVLVYGLAALGPPLALVTLALVLGRRRG
ncbi:MAG: hypothetical protein NW216_03975 [Hyphomicrobium sp.]|nr:hypothetical protein [Hyphomicrobium sp.]